MMKKLIYRRENISIAIDKGHDIVGFNLWVWYGYQQESLDHEYCIIEASQIKKDIEQDMMQYDHVCVSLSNEDDYVNTIIEIGKMVFTIAKKHKLLSEIILEDIYGDSVIINNKSIIVQLKALFDSHKSMYLFLFDKEIDRVLLFGKKYKTVTLTYNYKLNLGLTEEKKGAGCFDTQNRETQIYTSEEDTVSGISSTTLINSDHVLYFSVQCIEHLSHSLPTVAFTGKCNCLHGHSYCCNVTVKNLFGDDFIKHLSILSKRIHHLLHEAINGKKVEVTTLENIVEYVFEGLSPDFNILRIRLYETPNIQTCIYNN